MFETQPNTFYNRDFDRPPRASHAVLLNQAINLFNQFRWSGMLYKARNVLLRRIHTLFDLDCLPQNSTRARRYGGLKPVSLDQICGSLGRTGDFDNRFHPLDDRIRDRWVSIAMARKQNIPLAPVELIQVGDRYFVKDGHHRISVARAMGESAIDAEIIIWEVAGNLPWDVEPAVRALPQIA
jgi:hypothetical protein